MEIQLPSEPQPIEIGQDLHAQPKQYDFLLKFKNLESPNLIARITTENLLSYQEPGKSQLKWEKTIDMNMDLNQRLDLSNKDFNAAIIKIFQ